MAGVSRIPIKTLVRNKTTGQSGGVINDGFGCCTEDEVLVAYEGDNCVRPTRIDQLEIMGPDNAKPSPGGCGMCLDDKCCIYFTLTPRGFICERFGYLRTSLLFRRHDMVAKRCPTELFPACQLPNNQGEA
jgi:hypothetical protein